MAPGFMEMLKFDRMELIPAVIQDWKTNKVLMLGYMNRESIRLTMEKRKVHFWSRSRKKLWMKGETSGNSLEVKEILFDCDGDTILIRALPKGPICHTGHRSCFFRRLTASGNVEEMEEEKF